MAAMAALFMVVGYMIGGAGGVLIALAVACAMNFFAYWNADKIVLRMYRAIRVDKDSDLYRLVARLAKKAKLPMPKLYIINSAQPNAFATGRNPENAAIAVTSGLLHKLDSLEISGVIAHELAHIKNRDTLTMTITATLAGAISMLANMAIFSSMRNRNSGAIAAIFMVIFAPIAAALVQMAISRTREYSADRLGAEISGRPEALASALQKIENAARMIPNEKAEEIPASASLFIINPLSGRGADNWFATHPSTQNRINALMQLAETMQTQSLGGSDSNNIGTIDENEANIAGLILADKQETDEQESYRITSRDTEYDNNTISSDIGVSDKEGSQPKHNIDLKNSASSNADDNSNQSWKSPWDEGGPWSSSYKN